MSNVTPSGIATSDDTSNDTNNDTNNDDILADNTPRHHSLNRTRLIPQPARCWTSRTAAVLQARSAASAPPATTLRGQPMLSWEKKASARQDAMKHERGRKDERRNDGCVHGRG